MDDHELIIDSFAGGGGASLGIAQALGRSPDVAINHDANAIAMHAANHPDTRHLTEDVWKASPRKVTDPHAYLHKSMMPLRLVKLKTDSNEGGLFGGCQAGMCF